MAGGVTGQAIRLLSICVFRNGGRILVARGFDSVKNEHFLRPLGGAIEFGESAEAALRREIKEEVDAEITNPVRLGVLENVFTYEGTRGHEVLFVYDATFAEPGFYDRMRIPIREPIWDGEARWVELSAPGSEPLYPEGLSELLRNEDQRSSMGPGQSRS
jgi:ADP-ribose pyrophosphatase YjhB (NUDIX family)